jgi:hypothetical protein
MASYRIGLLLRAEALQIHLAEAGPDDAVIRLCYAGSAAPIQ